MLSSWRLRRGGWRDRWGCRCRDSLDDAGGEVATGGVSAGGRAGGVDEAGGGDTDFGLDAGGEAHVVEVAVGFEA